MALQFRNTTYREKVSGPEFAFDGMHSRCSRQIWVPWSEQAQALEDFLGYTTIKQTGSGQKYLSRTTPHRLSMFSRAVAGQPPRGLFYARSVSRIEGWIPEGQPDVNDEADFDEALVTFVYDAPFYRILDDSEMIQAGYSFNDGGTLYPDEASLARYCTPRFTPSGKYQTLPSFGPIKWDGTNVSALSHQAVLLHEGDLEIIWHQIPFQALPVTVILATVGRTNNATFGVPDAALGGVWPAGTLVMMMPKYEVIRMANGEFALNVHYKFKCYPNGANSFYRWDTNTFTPASLGGTGLNADKIFKTADFGLLFFPE